MKDVQAQDVLFTSKAIPHSLRPAIAAWLAQCPCSLLIPHTQSDRVPSPGVLPMMWPAGPRADTTLRGWQELGGQVIRPSASKFPCKLPSVPAPRIVTLPVCSNTGISSHLIRSGLDGFGICGLMMVFMFGETPSHYLKILLSCSPSLFPVLQINVYQVLSSVFHFLDAQCFILDSSIWLSSLFSLFYCW